MRTTKRKCAFCGKTASKLCDYQITIAGDTEKSEPITCDTELCDDCAVTESPMFACNTSAKSKSYIETFDFCPNHENTRDSDFHYPVKPLVHRIKDMHDQQASDVAEWRENHRVTIARNWIKAVPK